jgi:hypothetical protein
VGMRQIRFCESQNPLHPTGPMPVVATPVPDVLPPGSLAALLLAAIPRLKELGLRPPSSSRVLARLEVSRSRAYELKARLEARLPELCGPSGRPPQPASPSAPTAPATELLRYLYQHPGAVRDKGFRKAYSDGFRLFVLELLARHDDVPLEDFAAATALPMGTLKDWLRGGAVAVETDKQAMPAPPDIKGPLLQTALAEWTAWQGNFAAFCDHLQLHCRIPWGRSMIQRVLEGLGVRIPSRRRGRSPDEAALRESFRVWFPHAQWEGDGSHLPVLVDGELFAFNLELDVDAFSGAFVGAAVTPTEDSEAVLQTLQDAIATTGTRPLALLLDNKPSNHTEVVQEALDPTLLVRSTPYRGQSKPHVEGAFGLLKPTLEGLHLNTAGDRRQLAASYLRGLVTAVLRVLNHRPRRDREGLSRFQLLGETPTEEEVQRARQALLELQAKQDKARATRAARQDPIVRARLQAAYLRLGLDDPKDHILSATARYPLDAVLEGIAIYESKHKRGTLPEDVDARYLLGIVANLATEWESWELALALWDERIAARDEMAERLQRQRDAVVEELGDPEELLLPYIDRAMTTRARLDRFFWLSSAADVINDEEPEHHQRLFRLAARRIASTHAVNNRDRTAAIRFLAAKVVPLG